MIKIKFFLENSYCKIASICSFFCEIAKPIFRMTVRMIALPYCFLLINWNECKKNKFFVAKDLLYIFFVLRYYPYNYSLCRLWEKDIKEWKYYYGSIYDPFQRYLLGKEVQKEQYKIIFNDKELCWRLCESYGIDIPKTYCCIGPREDFISILKSLFLDANLKKIILKPVRGQGGKGIIIIYQDREVLFFSKFEKTGVISVNPIEKLCLNNYYIVQEFVEQHKSISIFSCSSVNTVRIVTLLTQKANVVFLGAQMRFGINNSFIDNTSSGGIGVGVDLNSGELFDIGYDMQGKSYSQHPDSKEIFKNFKVPFWAEIMNMSKSIQNNFHMYKLIGLDIAITINGPVLIEINEAHDNVGLEQKIGPILKNQVVFNEFKNYGLLFNHMQKKITW